MLCSSAIPAEWALAHYLHHHSPLSRASSSSASTGPRCARVRAPSNGRHAMAASVSVAAHLPLWVPACVDAAPLSLPAAAGAMYTGRRERRRLSARGGRALAGVRAEAVSGGGGGGKREPMVPPYNVLITGSTKGIGFGLAKTFLEAGDNVIICSRSGRVRHFVRLDLTEPKAELQMNEVNNVMVHNLSPGMVTTDLLMSGATTKQAKFFINILAEPPGVVADYLVPNIRTIPANQSMKPTYFRFLTGLKAYSRIFSRLAFGARKNKYVIED